MAPQIHVTWVNGLLETLTSENHLTEKSPRGRYAKNTGGVPNSASVHRQKHESISAHVPSGASGGEFTEGWCAGIDSDGLHIL
jgi:hypothetical protein